MPASRLNFGAAVVDRPHDPVAPGSGWGAIGVNAISSSRRFEYRQPRMSAGFRVEFVANGRAVHGLCTDVSEAGIRAVFDGSVIPNSQGLLILRHPVGVLELNAMVAYTENQAVGLIFHFQTPLEREMTAEFIATIVDHSGPSVVVRLP